MTTPLMEWISVATFILNLLILPLLKMLVDIKAELAKNANELANHRERIVRIETLCDRRLELGRRNYDPSTETR